MIAFASEPDREFRQMWWINEGGVLRNVDIKEYMRWHAAIPKWKATGIGYTVAYDSDDFGNAVSTVFLASDHGYGSTRPVLWESMVMSDDEAIDMQIMQRYASEAEALIGHYALRKDYLCRRPVRKFPRSLVLHRLRSTAWLR